MQRLGKNQGKYLGEGIDIRATMRDVETAAQRYGWKSDAFLQSPEMRLLALTRPAVQQPACRIYISTGIHGDEPAGPLAALRLLEENQWPADAETWLCPCLNPTGFPLNQRENAAGIDLNRQYRNPQAPETKAHVAWLERQPAFDFCLCLHEDWESHGFYLYELNPDRRPSLAETIVHGVSEVCPIDLSPVIEDRPAAGGIIRPGIDPASRPDWPEAFHLLTHKTRLSYTLEAPSDFPLATRVNALVAGVRSALATLSEPAPRD